METAAPSESDSAVLHSATQEGIVLGTPAYMSPEQACDGILGPASDVFSLGVIILEILTGKRLAALNAMPSDASFEPELEHALEARLLLESARVLANLLARSYNSDPRRRPADVVSWTEDVADTIRPAG